MPEWEIGRGKLVIYRKKTKPQGSGTGPTGVKTGLRPLRGKRFLYMSQHRGKPHLERSWTQIRMGVKKKKNCFFKTMANRALEAELPASTERKKDGPKARKRCSIHL